MERRDFLKLTGQTALAASVLSRAAQAGAQAQPDTMNINHLTYPLHDGWVHNWLNAGPQVVVIPNASYKFDPKQRPAIVKQFLQTEAQFTGVPVEGDKFQVEAAALEWKYFAAGDDHLLDQAVWYGSSRYLRAWSFVQLQNDGAARDVSFELFTNGPADAWLNDKHVHRTEEFDYVNPNPSKFSARLNAGLNTLLMRREHVMALGGPFVLALHLTKNGAGLQSVRVQIPTRTTDVARRQRLEAALQSAHLSRDNYDAGQHIALLVPRLESGAGPVKVELRSGGKAVREAVWNTDAKPELVDLGRVEGLKAGSYSVALLAEGNRRDLSFRIYAGEFLTSPRPGSTGEERRRTLLEGIADGAGAPLDPKKPPGNLLWSNGPIRGEIAKMHLNRWDQVAPSTLLTYIAGISRREDGADFRMLDLTALIIRYGQNPKFSPVVLAEARKCVLGWKYWVDEPGQTAMNFNSENHQLACHSAEILAGQLFPDETFLNNGKSGAWHREHGEKMALAWLEKRAAYGFEEWDANGYLAADTNLLSYLSTLAENPRIKSLAHQVLDKIFLSLALNSYQGSFGSTHGRTGWEYIRDSRNEPMASLAYIAWGVGAASLHADEALGILLADYAVPGVIAAIALDQPEAFWNRERQGLDPNRDPKEAQGPTNKVTFRTPDYMLASAQSWNAGKQGYQQHIWQATMGPDAVCFVTSPAFLSTDGNNRPNFWVGNKTLPRVAQWKDTLIAVHQGRTSDWLDWTHAYFPTWAFDEYKVTDKWAFARKGDGYLALNAANGLNLVETGEFAFRELRSPKRENIWLCLMGRRAQDGDFASFQAKVTALPVTFDGLKVQAQTLRGDTLQFGWQGPLLLNGKEQSLSNFPHFDNPYVHAPWPAKKLEIKHGAQSLTLDF